ncbi:MAG: hypothetical protein ACYTGZ_04785 [Planctomycetota bacterium]
MRGLALALLLVSVTACKSESSNGLTQLEVELLSEDVYDLMAVAFQTGENAFLGDAVSPSDIIEDATVSNAYTVTYDLDRRLRLGLGMGVGRVRLSVVADGQRLEDPLEFDFAQSLALNVTLIYELVYEGETLGGRLTDVAFVATLEASRVSDIDPFFVEYFIDGDCYLGETYARLITRLRAPGLPNRMIHGFGDGEGKIDDPDVVHEFDLDVDYDGTGRYTAEGWVGCCAWFRESFNLPR